MASATSALGLITLARDLGPETRRDVGASLRRLLRFHQTLGTIARSLRAPNATPIVALYDDTGMLRGCATSKSPGESGGQRLTRAFLAASAPARDIPAAPLAVEVVYAREARWLRDSSSLEIGVEGVALVRRGVPPVLLMAPVARDHRVTGAGLLAMLAEKAGLADLPSEARLVAWTVDRVAARLDDVEARSAEVARRTGAAPHDFAAAWLARMVDGRGRVAFAIDPRARILQADGGLWHARSAIAIEALAAHGGHADAVSRGRRWLAAEIARALRGARVPRWPDDPAAAAGTLALACLAGVDVRDRLRAIVADGRWRDLAAGSSVWPWHAGQVCAALGPHAPADLFRACIDDLGPRPFAPYTALAARFAGDARTLARATSSVASFVSMRRPHRGGVTATLLPETGLTAVAAHALAEAGTHRACHAAARAFVLARQLSPGRVPAALDARLALGAFSASPVDDTLRADVVGHALLAILPARGHA